MRESRRNERIRDRPLDDMGVAVFKPQVMIEWVRIKSTPMLGVFDLDVTPCFLECVVHFREAVCYSFLQVTS
jgi:hypothetical protein